MQSIPPGVAHVFDRCDPDAVGLVTRSGRYTYGELDRTCNRAAHALQALGVRAGDRVAASLPNDTDVVAAFHGAMRIGAIWVGINRALAAPEKAYLLSDSGATVYLAEEPPPVAVRHVSAAEWARLQTDDSAVAADVDPYAPAGIAYTSGTTGHPKGAVHSQYNLLVPGAALVATRGYGSDLRKGDCFPLTILNMQVLTTLLVAQAGGCSVVMDRLDAVGIAEWIRRERVTTWNGPPPILHTLAYSDEIAVAGLASLDEVWTGGADCPEELRVDFTRKFGVAVSATYGLSEAPTVVSIDKRNGSHSYGASGQPLPHLSVFASSDGEICVGPNPGGEWAGVYRTMLGYWNRPDATQAALAGGVLHTGDVGSVDDGYVRIKDRKNLVINRGGANVYPAEVERVLNAVPGVLASAVLGLPDERLGERVVAVIEAAPSGRPSETELRTACLDNLAKYKVPERFVFVAAFERNSMGKIQRAGLKGLFEGAG